MSVNFILKILEPVLDKYFLRNPKIFGDKSKVHISKHSKLCNTLLNTASGSIFVDDYVFFGHNVLLLTGTHDYNKTGQDRIESIPINNRDIIIKKGAWIGSNAVILGPCIIGENAVIAASSLVNKDVNQNEIVGGVPAKLIKKITFHDEL